MLSPAAQVTAEIESTESRDARALRQEVLHSLAQSPPWLPSRLFYDAHGARLFERICTLPEYYPTRCELELMQTHLADVAQALGPHCEVIEPGSGEGIKTRRLLAALDRPASYRPIDVAAEQLAAASERLRGEFPQLEVQPVLRDFTKTLELGASEARRVFYFPGSTIGNFPPAQAIRLLKSWRGESGNDGQLLIGVDLRKKKKILESAYNDASGVTAAFNLNILTHLNREIGSDFRLANWRHEAPYDEESGQITMWLRAAQDQFVDMGAGRSLHFSRGDAIRTEYSCKYDIDEFQHLAQQAGWRPSEVWTDSQHWFSLQLFVAE